MEVEKLFKGIAVIIDNEINSEESSIFKIKKLIESKDIPIATYDNIPNINVIPAFSNAAFIVLDWDYFNNSFDFSEGERIAFPDTLTESKEHELIDFLKKLMTTIFVPVFIFTAINSDSIINKLRENDLWINDKPNRIFIKQKIDISSESELFGAIEEWLKIMPSVYVLKEWENLVSSTKNKMFFGNVQLFV